MAVKRGLADVTEAQLKAREVVPFQTSVFADFVALIGRLFYDDGAIVLMDCLARAQRAMSETELKEKLKWRENLLHQKLFALEKQLLLERVSDFEGGKSAASSSYSAAARHSSQRWRIHCHVFVAVEWRFNAMTSAIQEEVRKASLRDDFECSNPSCRVKVDVIDAASGPKALQDDHPLCRLCGAPLTTARSEEAKYRAEDRQKRAQTQLARLREALQRVRGMEIPAFKAHGLPEAGATTSPSNSVVGATARTEPVSTPKTDSTHSKGIPWFSQPAAKTKVEVAGTERTAAPRSMTFGVLGSSSLTLGNPDVTPGSRLMAGPLLASNSGTDSEISSSRSGVSSVKEPVARSPLKVTFGAGRGTAGQNVTSARKLLKLNFPGTGRPN